jgi:Bifunctional DNA primase/polymerase, N-terminal/Primase C terminal 2 (PriCT-2)
VIKFTRFPCKGADNPNLKAALEYVRNDWPVFPLHERYGDGSDDDRCGCEESGCKRQGKHPGPLAPNGFLSALTDVGRIKNWWRWRPKAGIGIATGKVSGIIVIDADRKNGKNGFEVLKELETKLGPLPVTATVLTPNHGEHRYYCYAEGIGSGADVLGAGVDIRGDRGFIIAPPSHDGRYKWVDEDATVEDLPEAWVKHIQGLFASPDKKEKTNNKARTHDKPPLEKIEAALDAIRNDASVERGDWLKIGFAVWDGTDGSEAGFELFDAWSKQHPSYDAGNTRKAWARPKTITVATLFHKANEANPSWRDKGARHGASRNESIDALIADLARYSGIDFELKLKEVAKQIKVRESAIREAVEKLRGAQNDDNDDDPPPPTLEELAESAAPIIACKDVLGMFANEYGKLVTGDSKIGKILFLNTITRLFKKANHTAIKGTSSVGKSHERDTVLKFVPPEDVIELTSMSPKALLYMPEGFEHKILSMGEAHEGKDQEFQNMLLRVLMSESELVHHFVEKDEHGELVTMTLRKKGPVAFMVTTTQNKLHPENETRMLSLEGNDSQEQTKRVMDKIAQLEGRNQSEQRIDLEPWHDYQRWLAAGEITVDIPFARTLADLIPPRAVRLRRDFSQLLRDIKAHALLHRDHRKRNSKGHIVARIKDDYEPVRVLLGDVLATAAEVKLPKSVVETVQAVMSLHPVSGADKDSVLARAIAAKLKLDQSATSRRLKAAIAAGYVENLETVRGKPGRYRAKSLTDNDPKHEILPSCDELLAAVRERQQERRQRDTEKRGHNCIGLR